MKEMLKNISPFNNRADMKPVLFIIKKILAFWFCYIAGLFIAEGVAILLHFALGKNMLIGDVFDNQTITLIIYYGYVIVISVILFYWKLVEKKSLSKIGLTNHIGSYFIGVLAAAVMLTIIIGIIILTGDIEYHGIFERKNIILIVLFGGGFIVQGTMEELLCRGFLFHTLKDKVSTPVAIAISTIMFIIPHWSSLFAGETIYGVIGIINLILISLIFLLLTICFQSIWAACGLHSFWNFILSSIMGLNLSGNDENITAIFNMQSVGNNIWNGSIYGIEASVITTFILGFFSILLWVYCKRIKNNNEND
ncbi:MAG: CPBP family intramembrane metalloprotease [Lachnospiraceae bacterium]|nr:CPBP family intramembrane metalloprotease [Lachnospiraceae bacterium]